MGDVGSQRFAGELVRRDGAESHCIPRKTSPPAKQNTATRDSGYDRHRSRRTRPRNAGLPSR